MSGRKTAVGVGIPECGNSEYNPAVALSVRGLRAFSELSVNHWPAA